MDDGGAGLAAPSAGPTRAANEGSPLEPANLRSAEIVTLAEKSSTLTSIVNEARPMHLPSSKM